MLGATIVFAVQDGLSRHLAENYNVWMVVMVRYWFFAAFAAALACSQPPGLRKSLRPRHPLLQVVRGCLLVGQICLMVLSYTLIGLVESYAVFAAYPLVVAAMSLLFLNERVSPILWVTLAAGFVGVLFILSPGTDAFSWLSIIPLTAAVMNAGYGLITRYVGASDPANVSFLWAGLSGAIVLTPIGLYHWQSMTLTDWGFMAMLCVTGSGSHWLLIKAYEVAEAATIQPLAYTQLVWITIVGVVLFDESLRVNVMIGGVIVVIAGALTVLRNGVGKAAVSR